MQRNPVAWLRWAAGRLATGVVFYGEREAQQYVQRTGAKSTFVARNSLDQIPIQAERDAWTDSPGRLQRFLDEQDFSGRPYVLFVSRLQPDNRVDLLLEALARPALESTGVHAVIVGDGEAELIRLLEVARRHGVAGNVRWVDELTTRMPWHPGSWAQWPSATRRTRA